MKIKLSELKEFVARFAVVPGVKVDLKKEFDPGDTAGYENRRTPPSCWRMASSSWLRTRRSSTLRTRGACWLSCKRWMQPVRTALSST